MMHSFWTSSFIHGLICASASALPSKRQSAIPVLSVDFPDPAFLQGDDAFYAFATSSNGKKIQIARSPTFSPPSWQLLDLDALPDAGPWTDGSSNIWAPYVVRLDNGKYVLYYSAPPSSDPSKHCIGTATSSSITGPYLPSGEPWVCPLDQGGAIDPTVFRDPQSNYLYILYKIDGNSISDSSPTPIMLQRVDPSDGVTPIDPAIAILNKEPNNGPLIEAPAIMFTEGIYYLLFSSHLFSTDAYDLRYATSESLAGPYTQSPTPLLKTGDFGLTSPGSASVDPAGGNLLFHATTGWNENGQSIRFLFAGQFKPIEGGSCVPE